MAMDDFRFTPIGYINSPYKDLDECPRGDYFNKGVKASITLLPEYSDGLIDLDGFSHLILVWVFHKSEGYELIVEPPHDDRKHGVFATRAPIRPNPIGLTVVKLKGIEGNTIHIEDPDMLDGTPLLDIKPYLLPPETLGEVKRGWLDDRKD